jgi:hypothetical protein
MKVGITCYPTYGGSGIVATELGLELANRGHDVHFITYSNPIRLDPGIPASSITRSKSPTTRSSSIRPTALALASRMAEVAEQYNLDLLHVHLRHPAFISALLARQMTAKLRRLPFITTSTAPTSHWSAPIHLISRSPNIRSRNPTASLPSVNICASKPSKLRRRQRHSRRS